MSYSGAPPSATRTRVGKGKDKMAREMSILPLATSQTTSMPPRLSLLPFTLHHRQNVGRPLTSGPRTKLVHVSMAKSRSARVKKENRGRIDGQDQAGHLNRTVRTTCGLKWPGNAGFPVAIF
jgi:hypothetical protein